MSRRGLLFKAGAVAAALPLASLTSPLAVAEARPGRGQIGNFDLSPEDAEAAYQIVTSSSDFSTLNQLATRRDRRSHRARNAPFTRFRAESLNGYGTENATVLPLVEQDGFRIAAVNLAYDESLGTSDELPAGIHAFVDLNAGKLVGMFELQLEDLDRPPGRGHRRDRPAERIRARSRRADGSEKTIEADSRGIYAHQATAGISLDGAIRTPLTAPASSICPVVCSVIQTSICTVICIFASSFCSPLFMGACAAVCSTVACTVYSYYICTELPCVF